MNYTMADLERLSGLKARTIRDYIRLKYVPPPDGHGLGAVYTDEHVLRIVSLARMRAAGDDWQTIMDRMGGWSLAKLRAYVRKTDPAPPPPAAPGAASPAHAPAAPPGPAPALEGEPQRHELPPPGAVFDESTELDLPLGADGDLPGGAHFVMANVLPGLALLMRRDAAPLVKRVAAEILAKYAVTR